tara:strand:+ start:852 stop:1172 length:321 start_codon:yes stop_codon:yes gene_type:complete
MPERQKLMAPQSRIIGAFTENRSTHKHRSQAQYRSRSEKTAVFFWLDQGLMRMAGRYLAEYKLGFKSGSVRVYVREWNKQTAVVSTELRLGSWTRKTRNNTKAAMI